MSSTSSKVLAGCGIGCLLLIVLSAGVGFMGYRWVKETTESVEQASAIGRELEERYGQPRTFVPDVDSNIVVDRLETFLGVRDDLEEPREALAEAVTELAGVEREPGVASGWRAARAGIGLAPRVLTYLSARNRVLLDSEMGMGEYTWFYWLTYVAWLGHPADDSVLHESLAAREEGGGSIQIHVDEGMEPERITWRMRRDITAMLRNLESELAAGEDRGSLRELIVAELAELEADPGRVPWQDGPPEALVTGFEPYREHLEATYSPATNPFELSEMD